MIPCPHAYDILLNTLLNSEDKDYLERVMGLLRCRRYNLVPKYTVFYGSSPSGKTTLMNILAGVVGEERISYSPHDIEITKSKIVFELDGDADKLINATKNKEILRDVRFFIATNKYPKSTDIPIRILYMTGNQIDWPIYENLIAPSLNELIEPYRWYCMDRLTEDLEMEIK